MQQNMYIFWENIIQPILAVIQAKHIVEIGAADGIHTKDLLAYCKTCNGQLDVIDPAPQFDAEDWMYTFSTWLRVHKDCSLNILPKLEKIDAAIIDGDHNWYTVFHELQSIEKRTKDSDAFPIVIFHDTGWPYGRRDMYHDPECIPNVYRKPFKKKGISPDTGMLLEHGGINAHCHNSIEEHNIRNGVLTAIEDFIEESEHPYLFHTIPGFFGLGILVSVDRIKQNPSLGTLLNNLTLSQHLHAYVQQLEDTRLHQLITLQGIQEKERIHLGTIQTLRRTDQVIRKDQAALQEKERIHLGTIQTLRRTDQVIRKDQTALQEKNIDLQNQFEKTEQHILSLSEQLEHMHSTKSWRITYPLRSLCGLFRKNTQSEIHKAEQSSQEFLPLAGCTIVSKNFLAQARILAKSFKAHHPDAPFYVLIVDRINDEFDPKEEPFTIIAVDDIPVPLREKVYFQYTCRELNTAVKPTFLQWLFQKYDMEKLVYLDPDIEVFQPLHSVSKALDNASIVLTPHMLKPVDDKTVQPGEVDILRVGACNLGFIGLRRTSTTMDFLQWWESRLIHHCFEKPEEGLFFDQKWIDLVQSLFGDTHILRDETLNVAYWNLQERTVAFDGIQFTVNGKPLTFYHFSGFRPEDPKRICLYHNSNHQFSNHPGIQQLFANYTKNLYEEGYAQCTTWPYSFNAFENGIPITREIRRCYHDLGDTQSQFGNPFAVENARCFFDWLNNCHTELRADSYLTNLHAYLHNTGPNVRAAFDEHYAQWLVHPIRKELYDLDTIFLTSLKRYTNDTPAEQTLPCLKQPLIQWRHRLPFYTFYVRIAKKILPQRIWMKVYKKLQANDIFIPNNNTSTKEETIREKGIHFVGYFTSKNGVGQAARMHLLAAQTAGIPCTVQNISTTGIQQNTGHLENAQKKTSLSDIQIVHVNADQVLNVFQHYENINMPDSCNIGYWAWELSHFPERFANSFKPFKEIWTFSGFTAKAIAAVSPVPVVTIPLPISIDATNLPSMRTVTGIPQHHTLFLFMFDYLSIFERKNPIAAIEAFRHAFPSSDTASLLIKTTNADKDPRAAERLERYVSSHPHIHLMQQSITLNETHGLIQAADVYVSLHRAEGFGLTIAEAMALGKPVIATGYSGNMEFMNINNSFPIRYQYAELQENFGPYHQGNVWADPDIAHAASCMRYVHEHPNERTAIGARAARDIAEYFSPTHIGKLVKTRLSNLGR